MTSLPFSPGTFRDENCPSASPDGGTRVPLIGPPAHSEPSVRVESLTDSSPLAAVSSSVSSPESFSPRPLVPSPPLTHCPALLFPSYANEVPAANNAHWAAPVPKALWRLAARKLGRRDSVLAETPPRQNRQIWNREIN